MTMLLFRPEGRKLGLEAGFALTMANCLMRSQSYCRGAMRSCQRRIENEHLAQMDVAKG